MRARVIRLALAASLTLVAAGVTAPTAIAGAITHRRGATAGPGFPAMAAARRQPGSTFPTGVARPTGDGGFLIADHDSLASAGSLRTGTITTVAGNGRPAFSGDGGPATAASLNSPTDVEPTPDGGFVISDAETLRIRFCSRRR